MKASFLEKILSSIFTLILSLILIKNSEGQTFNDKVENIFKENPPYGVMHYKYQGDTLGDFNYPSQPGNLKHTYLWYKNKLLIQLDGTGILLHKDSKNSIVRLDSTFFQGYNFGSFNFVYQDTIFSLGGYGFWHFNGMLRYYNEKHRSWFVIKTNKLVPVRLWHNSRVYYDVDAKKIYAIYIQPKEEWTQTTEKEDREIYLQCFDLLTKKWWEVPKLVRKNSFEKAGWEYSPIFNTPFGMICFYQNEIKLIDFANNRIGNLESKKSQTIQENWSQFHQLMLISTRRGLYFINPRNEKIDSLSFFENDIHWTGEAIYQNSNTINYIFLAIGFAILFFSLGIFLFVKNYSNKTTPNNNIDEIKIEDFKKEPGFQKSIIFSESLTAVEKAVLDLILKNSAVGNMTSVNSVNEVLGISRKDVKAQNNIRASALQMINNKFIAYSGLNDELILKQRTAFDKRFFEYYIHVKFINKIK